MGKNSQKYKNITFSFLNLIYFLCTYLHQLQTHHTMGRIQTTNKGCWRNLGCFRAFLVPFGTVISVLFGEGHVLGFEIINFSDMQ